MSIPTVVPLGIRLTSIAWLEDAIASYYCSLMVLVGNAHHQFIEKLQDVGLMAWLEDAIP